MVCSSSEESSTATKSESLIEIIINLECKSDTKETHVKKIQSNGLEVRGQKHLRVVNTYLE